MSEKRSEQSTSIPSWRSAASMASATKLGRLRSTYSGSVSIVDAYALDGVEPVVIANEPGRIVPPY